MKKRLNGPSPVVSEMLEGRVAVTSANVLLAGESVAAGTDRPGRAARNVAVISGGGSAQKPVHTGHLGRGLRASRSG
ncbi:hypothetical protein [Paracoccus sp. S1E-3]|uniref:hypothetical protein n=1 Tax=Paracoccus sp. S1E-3 TaxID=2756130 RepID=UPI0015EE7B85|nr:hypothetical protein [Paracoccus sp. S1E-3]MBA4491827.1 hypothetical protein [Paracoccus sp. S1E-3]